MLKTTSLLCSLTVLGISIACHISTFLPGSTASMSIAWPLHFGAMAVFAAMVISLRRRQERQQSVRRSGKGVFAYWWESRLANELETAGLLKAIPGPILLACIAFFIYTGINFALMQINLEGGSPQAEKGRYYLKNHGRMIRELTREEFDRFQAYELREVSGHWILFSAFPALYFYWCHRKSPCRNEEGMDAEVGASE